MATRIVPSLVVELFSEAIKRRASDIHVRIAHDRALIEMRVYNALSLYEERSRDEAIALCHALYDASDSTQESKDGFNIESRYNVRIIDDGLKQFGLHAAWISSSPCAQGMVMVLHLVYADLELPETLSGLGYSRQHALGFELMKARPGGMNIVAGPKGAGKSTAIHRVLQDIVVAKRGCAHVVAVEDPVEGVLSGVTQVSVKMTNNASQRQSAYTEAIGVATKLDPDILMIGQISNPDSAELSLRAVLRGKQVWSTVEANNVLGIIDRLIHLGLDPKQILDPNIISGLVCQRLVATLCPSCKVPLSSVAKKHSAAVLDGLGTVMALDLIYVAGDGCSACHSSGVGGKTVVAEMTLPDWALLDLVRQGKKWDAYHYWRHEQEGETMVQQCIQKISDGMVDPFHAQSVLGPLLLEQYALSGKAIKPHDLKKIVYVDE